MREELRETRQAEVREIAYRLLKERGYAHISMLSISRQAKSSNETLYRWYGDKKGLFRTLVDANAAIVRAQIEQAMSGTGDALGDMEKVAPVLLAMLLGDRAIVLNKAAAGDESGELGRALAESGRETVLPLLEGLAARAIGQGGITSMDSRQAAELFVTLLVGDLQVRRVTGAMGEPDDAFINARSTAAMAAFRQLLR